MCRISLLIAFISFFQFSFAQLTPYKVRHSPLDSDTRFGYKDEKGKIVVEDIYIEVCDFKDGMGKVQLPNHKYGYIDATGKVVIPIKFTYLGDFHEGLAYASVDAHGEYYGYIDKTGKFIIQPRYVRANDFKNGIAEVASDASGNFKYGYIDKTGKVVIPIKFDQFNWLNDELVKTTTFTYAGEVTAYYDTQGKKYASKSEYTRLRNQQIAQMTLDQFIKSKIPSWNTFVEDRNVPEEPKLTEEMVQKQIMEELEKWKQKSEFESLADWQARVTSETAAEKVNEILEIIKTDYNDKSSKYQGAMSAAIKKYDEEYYRPAVNRYCSAKAWVFRNQDFNLSSYDAENETFLITTSESGSILLPVPKGNAQAFKENWESIKKNCKPVFVPVENEAILQSIKFDSYVYDSNTKAVYASNNVADNFKPLDIKLPENLNYAVNTDKKPGTANHFVSTSRSYSDIDNDIPATDAVRKNTIGIIIANENYQHCVNVDYALNDGQAVKEYFNKALGIPENQIFMYQDASLSQMVGAIDRISKLSDVYNPETLEIVVYYAGHGVPDDKDRSAYLIPTDSDPTITETCLPISRLYDLLGKSGAASSKVFLDACFSGSLRGDGMLMAARGVALKPRKSNLSGNTFVLSATSDDQTAWPYDEKKHGAFTYYLLKKIKETSGNVTLGELTDYVNDNVKKTIYINKQKVQTPQASTSFDLQEKWRDSKL